MNSEIEDLTSCYNSLQTSETFIVTKKVAAYLRFKRFLDIVVSFTCLVLLLPLLLLISVLVSLDSKGSVIFSQKRVGKNGKLIKVYKFRTMMPEAPENIATGELEDPHSYITKSGKILRMTSLDELPQLINVLKGDMSIVGPRPLILEEREIHKLRLKKGVYSIRPGITGLAQINGRDLLSIEDKVKFDTMYVQNVSLKTDFLIIIKSIFVVFSHTDFFEGKRN